MAQAAGTDFPRPRTQIAGTVEVVAAYLPDYATRQTRSATDRQPLLDVRRPSPWSPTSHPDQAMSAWPTPSATAGIGVRGRGQPRYAGVARQQLDRRLLRGRHPRRRAVHPRCLQPGARGGAEGTERHGFRTRRQRRRDQPHHPPGRWPRPSHSQPASRFGRPSARHRGYRDAIVTHLSFASMPCSRTPALARYYQNAMASNPLRHRLGPRPTSGPTSASTTNAWLTAACPRLGAATDVSFTFSQSGQSPVEATGMPSMRDRTRLRRALSCEPPALGR